MSLSEQLPKAIPAPRKITTEPRFTDKVFRGVVTSGGLFAGLLLGLIGFFLVFNGFIFVFSISISSFTSTIGFITIGTAFVAIILLVFAYSFTISLFLSFCFFSPASVFVVSWWELALALMYTFPISLF